MSWCGSSPSKPRPPDCARRSRARGRVGARLRSCSHRRGRNGHMLEEIHEHPSPIVTSVEWFAREGAERGVWGMRGCGTRGGARGLLVSAAAAAGIADRRHLGVHYLYLLKTSFSLIAKDLRASPLHACWAMMLPHRFRTETDDRRRERSQARQRLLLALGPMVLMLCPSASSTLSLSARTG